MFLPHFLFLRDIEEGHNDWSEEPSPVIQRYTLSSDRNVYIHMCIHVYCIYYTERYICNALSKHICGHSAHTWSRSHTRNLMEKDQAIALTIPTVR